MAAIIIGIIILGYTALIIYRKVGDIKKGKSCCSGCSGCPSRGNCSTCDTVNPDEDIS